MKISELSAADLSLWIAEKQGFWRIRGIWHSPERQHDPEDYCYPSCQCNLPDYVNDLAMTMMLLEKLNPGYTVDIEDNGFVKIWRYEEVIPRGQGRLGRAVAEAFALANGWPTPTSV